MSVYYVFALTLTVISEPLAGPRQGIVTAAIMPPGAIVTELLYQGPNSNSLISLAPSAYINLSWFCARSTTIDLHFKYMMASSIASCVT